MVEVMLQLIGTCALIGLGAMLFRTAFYPDLLEKHGRSVIATIGCFLLSVAFVRMLPIIGVLSQSEARTANGLIAVLFLAVLLWDRKVK